MSLRPLVGHQELRERFRAAARRGRFPQSLLLHGPPGVGKQRLALWTAALLQCEVEEAPCGHCRSCRLAERLLHPDIHWHFPLPRPRGAADERLRAKLEEARHEELTARREEPLRPPAEEEATGIYLAAVAEMRHAASRRPAIGRCTVFVVGEADRMVSQAASPEAANAFLKLLEEPPADTFLLLTSSRPAALLATVRSRAPAVRVAPLPEPEVAGFLREHAGVPAEEAERVAARSGGSIGRALRRAAGSDGEGRAEGAGEALLAAALSGSRTERLRLALALGASGARGSFRVSLEELAGLLRERLREVAAEGPPREAAAERPPRDAVSDGPSRKAGLRAPAGARRLSAGAWLDACALVDEALLEAEGNVNPQAIAATLLAELAAGLGASVRRSG